MGNFLSRCSLLVFLKFMCIKFIIVHFCTDLYILRYDENTGARKLVPETDANRLPKLK